MKPQDLAPMEYVHWAAQDNRVSFAVTGMDQAARRRSLARFNRDLREARCVEFDADASHRIGELSLADPDLLHKMSTNARLPWKRMLVSLDMKSLVHATRRGKVSDTDPNTSLVLMSALDEERTRIICTSVVPMGLIEKDVAQIDRLKGTPPPEDGIMIEPLGMLMQLGGLGVPERHGAAYESVRGVTGEFMETLWTEPKITRYLDQLSDDQRRRMLGRDPSHAWCIGNHFFITPTDEVDDWPEAQRERWVEWHEDIDRLASLMAPANTPYSRMEDFSKHREFDSVFREYVVETVGFARVCMTIVAAICDHTVMVASGERPRIAHLIKGKRRVMPKVTQMRIDLSKSVLYVGERHGPGYGTPRSKHDVRGHWRRYLRDGTPGCPHDWQPTEDEEGYTDINHQQCARCPARRTWVKDHERGSGPKHPKPVVVTA